MIDQEEYFKNVASYKLLAKHEVGQNFLIDEDVSKKIVSFLEIDDSDHVLEIGSGAGSLSYFIAQEKAEADLIDIDEALVTKLQHDFEDVSNIHPKMGNAMRYDMNGYTKIIGNLPYYITSGILEKILLGAKDVKKGIFMAQKEAFLRLNASLGNKDYAPLPLLIKYRAKMSRLLSVPRSSFSPAPHVDSVVFSLEFNDNDIKKANDLYTLLNGVFLHRRKTILNNLSTLLKDSEKAKISLNLASIPLNKRPEELSLEQYLKLLETIK